MVLEESEYDSVFEIEITEEDVETPWGKVQCSLKGNPRGNRPVILTYHDIGLNHQTCFSSLFEHEDMQEITGHFAVCHVTAIGQQEGASMLPTTGFEYPSMDQMSETLPIILKHFGIRTIIGVGVGAGAYILAKFALSHPDLVEGLVLINFNAQAEGWMDWAANKITGWTQTLSDVVITHLFGKEEIQNDHDLIATFRHHVTNNVNQTNLQHFVKSYYGRKDLEIERPVPGGNMNVKTLKCPSLLVVGDSSPAVDAVVDSNSRLDPTITTLLKMADCGGLPQIGQPGKLTEAIKYFVQGMGYMASASMTRLIRSRTSSGNSCSSLDGSRSRSQSARSQAQQGGEPRGRSHTDVSMESASHSLAEPAMPAPGTAQVTC
ncbi:protein NDRG1-like [Denticeps clupeoides]|uniref:Protein NDRG1 n=1 Tax=Denticeps clupeoides TaxID=299321 RepID=A0AAY4CE98_9TELE|nr:protein NDRG1-like [Denticeps clupeoides]